MSLPIPTSVSDRQWDLLAPVFSTCPRTGQPCPQLSNQPAKPGPRPASDRACLDAAFYIILNRVPWLELPKQGYPSYSVCYKRYISWVENGTWESVYTTLLADLQSRTGVDLPAEVQAHHLRKKGGPVPPYRLPPAVTAHPDDLRVGLLFLCHLTAILEDDSRRLVTA